MIPTSQRASLSHWSQLYMLTLVTWRHPGGCSHIAFLRFLAVLASFPVAIIKHPDESNLGEKGSFVHYNSDYSSSLWVRNRGRDLRQLVTLHPQSRSREEKINACFFSVHSLHSYRVRFPAQGMMLPTMGGSAH